MKRALWGAALARVLADAIDPRHEPVVVEVPPVWVGPSPNPDWCVVAGPRAPPGHRHVVAITTGWVGWLSNTTLNCIWPPASLVPVPAIGVMVKAAVSSSALLPSRLAIARLA